MKAYASYKASGSPWIGDLPSHWSLSRLRYEATISGGQVDPRESPWSEMTLVAPNHVESHTGRLLATETAAEQGADSGKYLVSAGQLIYSKIRPALNKVIVAPEDCLCSADMYGLSFRDRVDSRYAFYYMVARPVHSFASVLSMRVKMPKINREELADAPWVLPPLDEQQAIAAYLDHETTKIDTLIADQRRLIDLLRERRVAVATNLLGPRVGVGERLKWLLVEIDDRAGRRSEELPLLSVSISWGVRRRDEVVEDEARAEDLSNYKVVRPGDLVINRMRAFQGALGLASEEGIASPDYAVLEVAKGINAEWLAAVMKTTDFVGEMARRVKGIGSADLGNARTPRINLADLGEIRVDVPDLDVQTAEVQTLMELAARLDLLIAESEHFVGLARERRSALITAAVTGQIDVRKAA